MDINDLLKKKLKQGSQFSAGIAHIDVIGSSTLQGTSVGISETKKALKALVESLFEDHPVAILAWRGDGGLLLYHDTEGLDSLVVICDKLVNLLPFFNQARGLTNFLDNDEVHLRIVCHAGFLKNTGNADTLHHEAINYLAKREREVGVFDHVVLTEDVWKRLSDSLKGRLIRVAKADEKLGFTYVLDRPRSATTIQLNEYTSEAMLLWIGKSLQQKMFDEVYLFSYSNETLAQYLPRFTDARIRVLARNWMVEADEERAYYDQLEQSLSAEGVSQRVPRLRMKSGIIASWAELLVGPDHSRRFQRNIDIRFYDSPPWLKGAILRNSKNGKRAAFAGFYRWDPGREEGGSPYVGRHWSAVWLCDDDGSQSVMLDALESRFSELWDSSWDFGELKARESEKEQGLPQQSSIKRIWELDDKPYLILIPGRSDPVRLYPTVATEDLAAMRALESFLKDRDADVEFEIMDTADYSEKVRGWSGHIVYICHRTLTDELIAQLYDEGCPYSMERDPGQHLTITQRAHGLTFCSPMDLETPKKMDYGLVVKCGRPDTDGKLFVFAGIHAMGTLGGANYLSDSDHIQLLCSRVGSSNFAALVQCEFDGPWSVWNVKDVMAPEPF